MINQRTPRAIRLSDSELALLIQIERANAKRDQFTATFHRFIDAAIAGLLVAGLIVACLYFKSSVDPLNPLNLESHTDSIVEGVSQ